MRALECTAIARDDLAEIDAYWWMIDPYLSERLLVRLGAAAQFFVDVPHADRSLADAVRKWSVRGTPYLLLYRTRDDKVETLRVGHASRDWSKDA